MIDRPIRSRTTWLFKILALVYLLSFFILTSTLVYADEKEKIKIELFSLNRSVAYLGEEITAIVTINSPPSLRKKIAHLHYYLDKKEIGTQSISSYDSSGTARAEFKFEASPEGRFMFRAILKIEGKNTGEDEVSRQLAILSLPGSMTESTLTDRKEEKQIAGNAASQKPDLEPVSINFDVASPEAGQKVLIKSVISNSGPVQADNIKIRIFINGQPYGKDMTMSIDAASQAEIETSFLPASPGKKDVLLLINPDGEIDEKSNRNNLLSKTLFVRPREKEKQLSDIVTAPGISSKEKNLPNLVIYIETISGTHYTTDGQVKFYITNNSQSVSTKPFTMGIQKLQNDTAETWLLKKPVAALKPGETAALSFVWPSDQLASNYLYVATVDIDGVVDETEILDNHTRPFRVISTSMKNTIPVAPQAPSEISITRPLRNEPLGENDKLTVNWRTTADIGELVRISVFNKDTLEKTLSSITSNDGTYSIDLSRQPAGKYSLQIESEDGRVSSDKTDFQIKRSKRKTQRIITSLLSPLRGASYRGGQLVKITWNEEIKRQKYKKLDLVLLEENSGQSLKINSTPIASREGEYNWQMPDDGSVFGIYSLQVRSQYGEVLAAVDGVELLPNFVSFDVPEKAAGKKEILSDLGIARIRFNGPNLEFLVLNYGPSEITLAGMLGYKFTTYFVRRVPVKSDEDLVICTSTVSSELPAGEGVIVSLGRDPDCPLGEFNAGAKFEYAVIRISMPDLVDQYLIDPKLSNNLSKFYWP